MAQVVDGERIASRLATSADGQQELCERMRSFGVALSLVPADRGVVLEGISPTFYGKQMAQELARKARLVVVANRIQVNRTATIASETAAFA
jgi:hypothetical protein